MSKKKFLFEERQDLNLAIIAALTDEFEAADKIAARMNTTTGQILLPNKSYTLTSYLPTMKGLVEIQKLNGRSLYRKMPIAPPASEPPKEQVTQTSEKIEEIDLPSKTYRIGKDEVTIRPSLIIQDEQAPPVIAPPVASPQEAVVEAAAPQEVDASFDPFEAIINHHKQELERLETMRADIVKVRCELVDLDQQETELKERRRATEAKLAALLESASWVSPVILAATPTNDALVELEKELKKPASIVSAPEPVNLTIPVVRNGAWLFKWVQAIASNLNAANLGLPQSPFTFVPSKIKTKLAESILSLRRDGSSMTDLTEQQVKLIGIPTLKAFENAMIQKYGSTGYVPTEIYQEIVKEQANRR